MKRAQPGHRPSTRSRNNDILPVDVLRSIFKPFCLKDLAKFKAVSSSWKYSAEKVSSTIHKTPWLILPSEVKRKTRRCFFKNTEENIIYTMRKKTSNMLLNFPCIGSSHGWLILLDFSTLSPFLFNPFTEVQIELPSLNSLFKSELKFTDTEWSLENAIRHYHIPKAILTAEPGTVDDCGIVLICGDNLADRRLGFCKNGQESWIELRNERSKIKHDYVDIVCFENKLYALTNWSIHFWDLLNFSPEKGKMIKPCFVKQPDYYTPAQASSRLLSYLVELEGKVMLVHRVVIGGADNITHETMAFKVYRLLDSNQWIEVDSLGDRSLFIGGNHSVSISAKGFRTCRRNSIYFTDNFWCYMIHKLKIYRHDTGIFSLEDGSILPLYDFDSKSVQPLPCWVVPN